MDTYKCKRCGSVFDEPVPIVEGYKGMNSDHYAVVGLVCPECHSEDLEEGNRCKSCGEFAEGLNNYCKECHDDLEWYLTKAQRELNLNRDQLEEIITEHFGW